MASIDATAKLVVILKNVLALQEKFCVVQIVTVTKTVQINNL